MEVITSTEKMRQYSARAKARNKTIGFVPTMGYLHDGHLSLVKAAKEENDTVVLSIFVNPTQFSVGEDLDKYPRNMERDKSLAQEAGASVIFAPSDQEIYPEGLKIDVKADEGLSRGLCGSSRPGHFDGVTTVVAKLFDIVAPDTSYFGQKDAQQAAVIKKMVKDLKSPVKIKVMPIVREKDGLAMSSRNSYLTQDERGEALLLSESLKKAEEVISSGETSSEKVKEEVEKVLTEGKDLKIDYIEVVNADTFEAAKEVSNNTLIAIAASVGKTRLIDNTIIN